MSRPKYKYDHVKLLIRSEQIACVSAFCPSHVYLRKEFKNNRILQPNSEKGLLLASKLMKKNRA